LREIKAAKLIKEKLEIILACRRSKRRKEILISKKLRERSEAEDSQVAEVEIKSAA
jgi:hypothetical protein